MSELTMKTNRGKGDNRPFYRSGIEVLSIWTRIAMPEDSETRKGAIARLKGESMILVADNMKPAKLVAIISNLDDATQIKAVMAASKDKKVQAAGAERMDIINSGAEEAEAGKTANDADKDSPPSKDDILAKIAEASTVEEVIALDSIILDFKGSQDYLNIISDAQAARIKELAG